MKKRFWRTQKGMMWLDGVNGGDEFSDGVNENKREKLGEAMVAR